MPYDVTPPKVSEEERKAIRKKYWPAAAELYRARPQVFTKEALKEFEEQMPGPLMEAIQLWQGYEQDPDFTRKPMRIKNLERTDFFTKNIAPHTTSDDERTVLKRYFEPNFIESFAWAAVENLIPFIDRPPTPRPEHPTGALLGTLASDFGILFPLWGKATNILLKGMGKVAKIPKAVRLTKEAARIRGAVQVPRPMRHSAAAKRVIEARQAVSGAYPPWVQRGVHTGTLFGLMHTPHVAAGKADPMDILKSAGVGFLGGAPAHPLMKGTAAGTFATAVTKPEEARFTGIPLVDVGAPTGLLFAGFGYLGKGMAKYKAKQAKKLTPRMSLIEELGDYKPKVGDPIRPIARLSPEQAELQADTKALEHSTLIKLDKTVEDVQGRLQKVGADKTMLTLQKANMGVRQAFELGEHGTIAKSLEDFEFALAQAESLIGDLPTQYWTGGSAQLGLTAKGYDLFRGGKASHTTRMALERIRERPIGVEADEMAGLEREPLHKYIATRAVGQDRTYTLHDVAELGHKPETFHEYITTLVDHGLLDLAPKMAAPRPTYTGSAIVRDSTVIKRAITAKFEEIENMPITTKEKAALRSQVDQEVDRFNTKVRAETRAATAITETGSSEYGPKVYWQWRGRLLQYEHRIKQGGEELAAARREALAEGIPEDIFDRFATPGAKYGTAVDYAELERMTNQRIGGVGIFEPWTNVVTKPGEPPKPPRKPGDDPANVMKLLEKKGVLGTWDSKTKKIELTDHAGKRFDLTYGQLQEFPEVGHVRQPGEIVIQALGDPRFVVVKRGDLLYQKLKTQWKGKPAGHMISDFSKSDIDAILYGTKGYKVSRVTPDGGLWFKDLRTGSQFELAEDELYKIEKWLKEGVIEPMDMADVDIPTDALSYRPPSMPPTDGIFKLIGRQLEQGLLRPVTPTKPMLAQWEKFTKLPIVERGWRPTERSMSQVRHWQVKLNPKLRNLRKILTPDSEEGILEYIKEKDWRAKLTYIRKYKLADKDLHAAKVSESILQETFGSQWREFITDYIPRKLQYGETTEALRPWIRNGLNEAHWASDGGRLTDALINAANTKMRMWIEPHMDEFKAMKRAIRQSEITPGTKSKIIDDIELYQRRVQSSVNNDRAVMGEFFNAMNQKFGWNLKGTVPDTLLSMFMLTTYSALMPFRLALCLRNLTQTVMTTLLYSGPGNWKRGAARACTPEGWKLGKELGFLEFTGVPMEHVLPKGVNIMRWLYDKGMIPYKAADTFNRVVSANIGYTAMQRYGPQYMRGRIDLPTFKRKTGIVYFEDASQKEILAPLLHERDLTKAVEASSKLLGLNYAEDTQWLYRVGASPRLFKTRMGKLLGQFGIWPTNYTRFAIRGVKTGDALAREQFIARWLLINTAMAGVTQQVLGIDSRAWLFSGVFNYVGGPYAQMLRSALDVQSGGWKREQGLRELKRSGRTLIPFYTSVRDAMKLLEEPPDIKGAIGFRSYPPEYK